jgi:PPP family 3-phenylpropionic acid transporter
MKNIFPLGIREGLKLPVFYFIMYGAFASWQSFFNVHLDRIGFSSLQIGTLNAVFISTSAIVVPFWGMIADRYGNNRILILLTSVCAALVFLIGQTLVFYWMLLFIALISLFHSPTSAVMDGMTMGFIRNRKGYSYGQFRLWGSAGYAVASLVVGFFAKKDTATIFFIAGLLFALFTLVNLATLPPKPVTARGLVSFKSFNIFFRNRQLAIFLFLILFYGVAVSPLHQFINLYYSDIGASNALLGLAFFVQAGFEMPTFLIGVWLLKRAKPEQIILFSIFISMIRMVLYGFIAVPEYAIIVSAFHGITIAFFLVGVVEYVQLRTPDHLRTTGQAMIYAFHFGAGVTLGNLLLGFLREETGMLRAMHIHSGLAMAVLLFGVWFFKRRD